MKTQLISKNSLLALLFLAASASVFAQNMDHRNVVSFSTGLHLGNLISGGSPEISSNDQTASFSVGSASLKSLPTFQLGFDRATNKWFSIGGSIAFAQMAKIATKDFDFLSADSTTAVKGDLNLALSRTTIQIRPLFHYGNSGRLDMYSGIKIGLSIWSAKTSGNFTGKFEDIQDDIDLPGRLRGAAPVPNVQVTLFGLRGYVTENIGVGFELGVGGPYMLAGQVTYRI